MKLPIVSRKAHDAAVAKLERRLERSVRDLNTFRSEHFRICDCHDSWGKCGCAEMGRHSPDCGCCPLGVGVCGPLPVEVTQ